MQKDKTSLTPAIDFERSELRYIFYMHDQNDLINDFLSLGFKIIEYPESPITQTVYFSSTLGLDPGFSIKARIYTTRPANNVMAVDESTFFNLLEIKSTVSQQEATIMGLKDIVEKSPSHLIDSLSKKNQEISFIEFKRHQKMVFLGIRL